jgi:hypothetical protein
MNRGRAKGFLTRILANKSILTIVLLLALATSVIPSTLSPTHGVGRTPQLSQFASLSKFAKVNHLGGLAPVQLDQTLTVQDPSAPPPSSTVPLRAGQVNKDFNKRPQNEPSVTVNPNNGQIIVGANDYGIGVPIGGGVYSILPGTPLPGETYMPPFPSSVGN